MADQFELIIEILKNSDNYDKTVNQLIATKCTVSCLKIFFFSLGAFTTYEG